jgi:predicted cupin superfamily sugar epimerase
VANDLARRLGLEPIPHEGGWFRQTWRGPDDEVGRPIGTAIMAMFTDDDTGFSALHRLDATEVWHFYGGDPFVLVLLSPDGTSDERVLGAADPQVVVAAGTWMGGHVGGTGPWSLLGMTMAPGFSAAGFELGSRRELTQGWPDRADVIRRLTREDG